MGNCGSKNEDKNKTYHLQTLVKHEKGINCMAVSEDGSVLATGGEDKTACLWSTKTEECECIGILQGHDDYITCILIEDCFVLTGCADKTVRKWDVGTCECVLVLKGHTSVIYRMICTGDFIFTSSYDRTARCWDFDNGECIRVFRGHKRGVYPLIFIPADEEELDSGDLDNDILITGSADFTARTWNFETGKEIRVFKGHKGAVTCMSVDPTGRVLFTGSTDFTIRSWDLNKGVAMKTFEGHQGSVICMQVVNKIMYTGSSDHTGRSWVTEFGDCTRIYKGHRHTVSVIKVFDGLVYTACGDAICRCFDAKSGAPKREFKGHESTVTALQVVGGKLFTSSYDGSVMVWDCTGIKDDTVFGTDDDKEKSKDKIQEMEKFGGDVIPVDNNQNNQSNSPDNKIMIE